MTTYDVSKLTDAKILADKPITQGQGRALRDNLLAVIEGDVSAPQIQLGAIAFGSDVDGAFTDASAAPTVPGFYDYSSFLRTTPVTFPNYSIVRVQGDFTLSALLTVSPVLLADYDRLLALGAARGNHGGDTDPSGGGSIGSGGGQTVAEIAAAVALGSASRFWAAKRGWLGGLGGVAGTGISRAGGSFLLIVTGNCNLAGGTIDASAPAGTGSGFPNKAGGGAGGSVIIVSRGYLSAGTLKAKGAAGSTTSSGGGAGGLVQTAASSYPIAQTTDVTAGANGSGFGAPVAATAGSVVQETLTAARILGLLYR